MAIWKAWLPKVCKVVSKAVLQPKAARLAKSKVWGNHGHSNEGSNLAEAMWVFCFAATLSLATTQCFSLNKQKCTAQQLFCQTLTMCTLSQQVIKRVTKGGQWNLSLWIFLYMFAQWCPVITFLIGSRCDSLCIQQWVQSIFCWVGPTWWQLLAQLEESWAAGAVAIRYQGLAANVHHLISSMDRCRCSQRWAFLRVTKHCCRNNVLNKTGFSNLNEVWMIYLCAAWALAMVHSQ